MWPAIFVHWFSLRTNLFYVWSAPVLPVRSSFKVFNSFVLLSDSLRSLLEISSSTLSPHLTHASSLLLLSLLWLRITSFTLSLQAINSPVPQICSTTDCFTYQPDWLCGLFGWFSYFFCSSLFYSRRNSLLFRRLYMPRSCPSVCPSVRLSVLRHIPVFCRHEWSYDHAVFTDR